MPRLYPSSNVKHDIERSTLPFRELDSAGRGFLTHEGSTRLGTLGYLPWEIRQQIFAFLVASSYTYRDSYKWPEHDYRVSRTGPSFIIDPPQGFWKYDGYTTAKENRSDFPHSMNERFPEPFDLYSYYLKVHQNYHKHRLAVRLASPDLKNEFEHAFLANQTFFFDCAVALARFLNRLSDQRQAQLRSLHLDLYGCGSDCCIRRWTKVRKEIGHGWTLVCAQIPKNLVSVQLELGCVYFKWPPWHSEDHVGEPQYHRHGVSPAKQLLEVISKQIVRRSPQVRLELVGDSRLSREEHATLSNVIGEVES